MSELEKPQSIQEVCFDFSWDEHKVWALELPTTTMSMERLKWHFDRPFIWSKPNGYYDVLPRDVMANPDDFPEEFERTKAADTKYPIDIMYWRERWLILDGLHRLMKQQLNGESVVSVRKVPKSAIPLIRK